MIDLVIIGNGFDLAHGYKTKYSDFIDWYIQKSYSTSKKSGWATMGNDLIKILVPGIYSKKGELDRSKLAFECNHEFFKEILNKHRDSNWEGIERDYFLYLYKAVTNSHKLDPLTFVNLEDNDENEINNKVANLNECLSIIKKELAEYLKSITPNNISSINHNGSILDSLQALFAKCKMNITQKSSEGDVSDYTVVLLNFNYTHTAESYYNYFCEKYNILSNTLLLNIHGNLSDKKTIIFGYGDESDKRYSELEETGNNDILSNFKSFDYLQNKEYSTLIELLENQEYNIHIMGHSCGVSDRVLLKELFCSDNCQKIKIYYHKREDRSNDYKEKTMNISRIFPLNQKAAMRKKIINIKDCKPL